MGYHGFIWECLVATKIIREHLKKAKVKHLKCRHMESLGTAINLASNLAQRYCELIIILLSSFLTVRKNNGIFLSLNGQKERNDCRLLGAHNAAVFYMKLLSHPFQSEYLLISLISYKGLVDFPNIFRGSRGFFGRVFAMITICIVGFYKADIQKTPQMTHHSVVSWCVYIVYYWTASWHYAAIAEA